MVRAVCRGQTSCRTYNLEGSLFPVKMRNLGLKTTRFSSVFNNATQLAVAASLVGPVYGRVITLPDTVADRGNNSGRLWMAGAVELVAAAPVGHIPQVQLNIIMLSYLTHHLVILLLHVSALLLHVCALAAAYCSSRIS